MTFDKKNDMIILCNKKGSLKCDSTFKTYYRRGLFSVNLEEIKK